MATTSAPSLQIRKLADGGYVVGEGFRRPDEWCEPFLFACSEIDDALAYMKDKLEAAPPK